MFLVYIMVHINKLLSRIIITLKYVAFYDIDDDDDYEFYFFIWNDLEEI